MKKLSVLCFILPLFLFAQEEDFQTWSKVELGYKISKKLSTELTEGFRLRENSSLPAKAFTDLSLTYRHNKKWRFGTGYRFIQLFDLNQDIHLRHRMYADVVLRNKVKRWRVNYRSRLQHQVGVNHMEQYYRARLSASYNIRKTPLEPSLAIETFCDLNALQFDKMRYTLAAAYPLSKEIEGVLYYRLQEEVHVSNPNKFYILGMGLSVSL